MTTIPGSPEQQSPEQQSPEQQSRYDPVPLEKKWQERWEADGIYRVPENDDRPRWYEMTMYPYPSGDLHIGHWYAMAPADSHARFRRMQGYNVLHPMGFDAFGLPAENAAISRGIHPYEWTMSNIENMRGQLRSMGSIYDWSKEIICALPEYYRWNQWFFLKLYEKGLAYRAHAPVVWCPSCATVLANEQVLNGCCERCQTPITRRDLAQWFLRITDYAEELLDFDGLLDWPERILAMQRNWVGRSEGAEISFDISHYNLEEKEIRTFTTRLDTIYGVTFMVLAPEHPLVSQLTAPEQAEAVQTYIQEARAATEIERLSTDKEKTGVPLGTYAVNRLNGEQVPLLIADYVLMAYGTGAVMGVPAHDQRDFEFATKYGLPIQVVISPPNWSGEPLEEAYPDEGHGELRPLRRPPLRPRNAGHHRPRRAVRLGQARRLLPPARLAHIPPALLGHPHPYGPLPFLWHRARTRRPATRPPPLRCRVQAHRRVPLAGNRDFVETACPKCGGDARRETDTMDTFVDSSWYMMRYTSPDYDDGPFSPRQLGQWLPVDQYTGGAEHAVMHLLYSRFFTKALRDLGLVDFSEPFLRLYNQGTIVAGGAKMSKSRGNVVSPDVHVKEVGADTVRAYLMFLGPWDQGGDWSDAGINGMARWMNRVWEICQRDANALEGDPEAQESRDTRRRLHQTIRKCYQDLDRFKFNTTIASLMEFSNHLNRVWAEGSIDPRNLARVHPLHPAYPRPHGPPHHRGAMGTRRLPLQHPQPALPSHGTRNWPPTKSSPSWSRSTAKCAIGFKSPPKSPKRKPANLALGSDKVQVFLSDKQIEKAVYVPGRLVNVVVK